MSEETFRRAALSLFGVGQPYIPDRGVPWSAMRCDWEF